MKKLLLLLLFSLCSYSQTTKMKSLIVIQDNYERSSYNNISQGLKIDYEIINDFLTHLENRKIVKVEKNVIRGRNATVNKIIDAIQEMKVTKDDIIFFYISGHGAAKESNQFLLTSEGRYIYRKTIEGLIKSKGAKLNLIFVDACSKETPANITIKGFQLFSSNSVSDISLKSLFRNYIGTLSISSSSIGEYSFADNINGSFFTAFLFGEQLSKRPAKTWQENFLIAKNNTIRAFNRLPENIRNDLIKENVFCQTPVMNDTPKYIYKTIPKTKKIAEIITIKNTSDTIVTFTIDRNDYNTKWNSEKLEKFTLLPKKEYSFKNISNIYFYNTKEYKYYTVSTGIFYFDYDHLGNIDLFLK